MSILAGGILVDGDTPTPTPTTAVPIVSVPITEVGGQSTLTLPANYVDYNLLGFTYRVDDTVWLPYVIDLNYIKTQATLEVAFDYTVNTVNWVRGARTLTSPEYGKFHDAWLYIAEN